MQEIAIHSGPDDSGLETGRSASITIYRYTEQKWKPTRHIELAIDPERGMSALRIKAAEIRLFLGTCTILLFGKLPNVFVRALENKGVDVWEYEAEPELLLDYVWEQVELEKERIAQRNSLWPVPKDLGDGRYVVSLMGCQAKTNGMTTKQVLESFLERTPFKMLEVYCSHMPPWMAAYCENGRLKCRREQIGVEELRLVFSPAARNA